jgi:hypothetical protein
VTKLCDLGNDDGVCSVGWAHRGTHLAIGTSNGKVQVSLVCICFELLIYAFAVLISMVYV